MTGLQVPTLPQPDPLPQPGPGWLFWALLMVTFVAHLVAMNVMLGGTVIAAVARWRRPSRSEDGPRLAAMAALVARFMPAIVSATVTLGVAPLLFVQLLYGRLFFSSSILMAWVWLSVVGLLVAAYSLTYAQAFRAKAAAPPGRVLGWMAALLLVAVAFIYVNNVSLAWRPDRFAAMYGASSAGLHLNLDDATLVPRFLHMVLGALAVGGLGIAVMGLFIRRRDEMLAVTMVRHGAWWFTGATAVNLLAGIWWVVALPRETLIAFMSGSLSAPLVLMLGIVTGFAALALMALCIQVARPWTLVKASGWLAVATIALMALTRDQLRHAALASAGFSLRAWVVPQWGAIAIFIVLLAVSLASVAWMVAALVRGAGTGRPAAESFDAR